MKAVLSFTIPTTFPGENEIIRAARSHWSKGAAMKKTWTTAAYNCIPNRSLYGHISPPVTVDFRWYEKDSNRDPDNVIAAQKFILDGMVAAGVIANDSQKFICGLRHSVFVSSNPRVEVDVYEGVC